MSQQTLDVFFRHKFLILLPLVVLVLAGVAASWSRQSTVYSASANVWIQGTPFLATSLNSATNPFLTPAQNQAQIMNDLLRLDSFGQSVGAKVDSLAGLDPKSQAIAVRRGTFVSPDGVQVLSIGHHDEDPALTRDIVQAIVDTYSERVTSDAASQVAAAEAFYEERLAQARTELDEHKAALEGYEETNGAGVRLVFETRTEVARSQENYDSLLDRLAQIHLERDKFLTGTDIAFQVMDPPDLPLSPLPRPKRDLLMLPAIGLLLGVSASAALLLVMTRLDRSIRLPAEAQTIAPVLAVVPELGRRRRPTWPRHFVRLAVVASRGLVGNTS